MNASSVILAVPATTPPFDVMLESLSPRTQASTLIIVSTLCLFFMVILHLQRMWVKLRTNHKWGIDDCFCTLGKLGSIGYAATCLSTIVSGVGTHQWEAATSALSPLFLKKLYAINILLPVTFMFIKLSLLMLYLSIFRPNQTMRYFIYSGIIGNTLFYTACLGAQIVAWTPATGVPWFETSSSPALPTSINLGIAQSAFNVISDLYLLGLPLWGIAQLQMSFKKKIGVSAIFTTGASAVVASILTLIYRIKLVGNPDTTWDLAAVYTLSIVETTVGIMCSCMPALASFFRLSTPLFQSLLLRFSFSLASFSGRKESSTSLNSARKLQEDTLSDRHSSQELKLNGKDEEALSVRDIERGLKEVVIGGWH